MDGDILTVGVLALQGAVSEHLEMLEKSGARGIGIKKTSGLNDIDGLIIPGGESTTIGKLIEEYGFSSELKKLGEAGLPIFGTCAGLIVLATRAAGRHGPLLGLARVSVERNAFGRQVDSFEVDLKIKGIELEDQPFRAVFIRAPLIREVENGVQVLAELDEGIVMAQDRNYLLTAFHPELTGDVRVHRYFLGMVRSFRQRRSVGG